jgi:hypothetical protein
MSKATPDKLIPVTWAKEGIVVGAAVVDRPHAVSPSTIMASNTSLLKSHLLIRGS